MGTSAGAVITDKLGRRSGPRRKYSVEEKRAMVEETQVHGASVPEVAQRHGVNANLLSVWRRLYRRGLLTSEVRSDAAALLPVEVSTPTMLPTKRTVTVKATKPDGAVSIEVEFASG
jgi:transposase